MINILFSCAGRRTYLLRYFKQQLGNEGKIIATDMQLSAPALSAADVVEQVPAVFDPGYVETLLDVCKRNQATALISLNDLELEILADNRELFIKNGITPIISRPEVVRICADKTKTADWLTEHGFRTPRTYSNLDSAVQALDAGTIHFPVVVKPRWGSGSIGIEIVQDMEELRLAYLLTQKKVMRSILAHQSSASTDYIMIQECICGKEYGMDIMNDLQGNHIAVSVKQKLAMRAGETDKAVTVDTPALYDIGRRIGETLGHIGNLDIDVLEDASGNYYVLEMNPRFGGGFPFSYEAGVNLPKAIIEWLKGNAVDRSILQPEFGKAFAKCDYLVPIKAVEGN